MVGTNLHYAENIWNPITGCSKVSEGCRKCDAEMIANRMMLKNIEKYKNGFNLTFHEDEISQPYRLVRSRVILVNTMSDTFHEDVSLETLQLMFRVMNDNYRHIFQVLTKRAERMLECDRSDLINLSDNIWLGVSVENNATKYRIDLLRQTRAKTKFVFFEPLLENITGLDLTGIDWVVVGGERGNKAQNMAKEWVINIRDLCLAKGIPFYFKQWGGRRNKLGGSGKDRLLDGKTYDEMPPIRRLGLHKKGTEKGKFD